MIRFFMASFTRKRPSKQDKKDKTITKCATHVQCVKSPSQNNSVDSVSLMKNDFAFEDGGMLQIDCNLSFFTDPEESQSREIIARMLEDIAKSNVSMEELLSPVWVTCDD